MIGDYVTEVNITSPSGIQDIDKETNCLNLNVIPIIKNLPFILRTHSPYTSIANADSFHQLDTCICLSPFFSFF